VLSSTSTEGRQAESATGERTPQRHIGPFIIQPAIHRAAWLIWAAHTSPNDPGRWRKHQGMLRWRRVRREDIEAGDVNRSVRYRLPTGRASCSTGRRNEAGKKDIMCNSEAAGQLSLIQKQRARPALFSCNHFLTEVPPNASLKPSPKNDRPTLATVHII
jgi:hypothetical protein